MRQKKIFYLFLSVFYCQQASLSQNLNSTIEDLVIPNACYLEMSLEKFRDIRPNCFEGPKPYHETSANSKMWLTFMEMENFNKVNQISFWYLFTKNKLVGVLKTTKVQREALNSHTLEVANIYTHCTKLLGSPKQEKITRRIGGKDHPVQVDIWRNKSNDTTYHLVATINELTLAVVRDSDFPISQIFVKHDPSRLGDIASSEVNLFDIARPSPSISSVRFKNDSLNEDREVIDANSLAANQIGVSRNYGNKVYIALIVFALIMLLFFIKK